MRRCLTLLLGLLAAPATLASAPARPHVLLVIIDDAGYSDLGAYGGDAATPVLDALAARGTKLSRFYASPQCGPTRAMLVTGSDNHEVGIGSINEALPPDPVMRAHPSYAMRLAPESETIAERLRAAGYYTLVTGKWGIGKPGSSLPEHHGFDRSHVLDASGADNWEQRPYLPLYDTAPWWADGVPVTLPEDFYSSDYIVDRTIDLLQERPDDKPFFAMVGFQAIHVPVQVGREWTDKYAGRFDAGWDALRTARSERVRALGLVPQDAPGAAPPTDARPWTSLEDDKRALYARMMQVNAGMLEAMDFHLGRLIDHLQANNQLDNTIVIVLSDNGPEPVELPAQHDRRQRIQGPPLIERIGEKGTAGSIGPEWATVSSAPLSLFKYNTSEGGIRVPLIIAGPGVPATPVVHARAHVTDILPTILDFAGVPTTSASPTATPLRGRSLRPALIGAVAEVYGPADPVAVEVGGNAALFRGNYKLVKLPQPWGDAQWRLYDVVADPGETRDLTAARPELAAELRAAYDAIADDVGIIEMDRDYSPSEQIWRNNITVIVKKQGPKLLAGIFICIAVVVAWRAWRRRRRQTA